MQEHGPYRISEEPGTKYYCSCGLSANMPRCDGSHKGSGKHPYRVEVEKAGEYAVCGCGRSSEKPWCDGSHRDAR